jgi:NitT/TauT family transport system substrate-binding protein
MMDREKSAKLEWMPFFDHGVNVLSTGIVVNEQFLKEKPEVVRSFLAGTVRGIQYEKANPDEASEIFSKYAPSFHKELAKQEIEQTLPLLETENTRGQPTGCMSLKDFQSTYELLVRYGSLKAGLDPAMFFTNDYLPAKCPG